MRRSVAALIAQVSIINGLYLRTKLAIGVPDSSAPRTQARQNLAVMMTRRLQKTIVLFVAFHSRNAKKLCTIKPMKAEKKREPAIVRGAGSTSVRRGLPKLVICNQNTR